MTRLAGAKAGARSAAALMAVLACASIAPRARAEALVTVDAPAASREPQRTAPPSDDLFPWGEAGPPLHGHQTDIDFGIAMPWDEPSFASMRTAYLTPDGEKWLAAIMERAKPFLPYIEERVRFYGLPDELAFLPVIESEFSPRNVSKSGASGLWQFMRNSISGYGMKIDDWVDERRDFMKSTDGALRKLADNFSLFGDWAIAIAAYNCGNGAMARAIAAAKQAGAQAPDYWDIRKRGLLNPETSEYVPKFLAVASILRYPGRNGLPQSWEDAVSWATVAPGRPVDLKMLSELAGVPLDLLRDANPELRYGVTPPGSGYALKVPSSAASAVRAVFEDASRKLVRYYLHIVRSGDTMSGIARRYGAPLPAIVDANPGLKPDRIYLGQTIAVPALKDAPPPEPAAEGEAPNFASSYTVAKGDTLWSISLRFEVQPETLAERNNLTLSSVIREGMALRVPILKAMP